MDKTVVKQLTLIFAVLVLAGQCWGAHRTITSLPYTFTPDSMTAGQIDTLFISGTKLVSNGNGIWIRPTYGHPIYNVVLNLAGDTIVFDDDSTGGAWGLYLGDGAAGSTGMLYNVTAVNGYIIHGVGDGAEIPNINGVIAENWHSCTLRGLNVSVAGQQTSDNEYICIRGMYLNSTWNTTVVGCRVINHSTGWVDRVDYPACGIRCQRTFDDSHIRGDTTFSIRICSTYVASSHVGILCYGYEGTDYRGVFELFNDTVVVSANNVRAGYTGYRIGNPYAIHCRGVELLRCYDNVLIRGTDHDGGSGILFEASQSNTLGLWNEIYNNYIVHSCHEDGYQSAGLRIRTDVKRLRAYNNTILGYSDTLSSTHYIGDECNGIMVGTEWSVNEDSLEIYNNHVVEIGAAGAIANALSQITKLTAGYSSYHDNYWGSNNRPVALSLDDKPVSYFTMLRDSLSREAGYYSYYTSQLGLSGNPTWTTDNCRMIDCVPVGATSDTSCLVSPSGAQQLEWFRWFKIKTVDSASAAINAGVTITNHYGNTIYSNTTGSDGIDSVLTKYWRRTNPNTDSTSFNPFIIRAATTSDTTWDTVYVGASCGGDTLVVGGTPPAYMPKSTSISGNKTISGGVIIR